jgi:hypothetical protein
MYSPASSLKRVEGQSMGKLALFICGLVLGAVGAFGWLFYQKMHKPPPDNQIVFARKNFYDSKQTGMEFGLVAISGTLTGKGLGYPNNTYAVSCYDRYKACFVAFVEQIGNDQISRMQNPFDYPIVKWTEYEVIAQEEPALSGCFRVTITIDRKREALLWVEEPINQTRPNCKDADTSIRKYSIEDSPAWQAMRKR